MLINAESNSLASYSIFEGESGAMKGLYEYIREAQRWRPLTVIPPGPQIIVETQYIFLGSHAGETALMLENRLRSACFRVAAPREFHLYATVIG